ncbi:M20 family metallopeptidase [Saccharopolyspora sp. 5N708]|uniref:M20 family metallopeptidase n=1 Tax=Saccharopolyspora sp. 5N708 TaxID=3457424 RepID=UPI003FD1FDD6
MASTGAGDAVAEQCVARIDRERLAATLGELIGLPSVNPFGDAPRDGQGEQRVAQYLNDRLERLGWGCEVVEYAAGRYNAIGRLAGGGGRSLMFAGHLDTVETTDYPEPFAGTVRDGRVYGRGACDMKAALACYLEVAEVLAEQAVSPPGEVFVAGVGDEEFRQEGAKALGASGPLVDGVIIGEPTELTICHATKGLAAYDLVVTGEATHGSVPQHGSNAILGAAALLTSFGDYQRLLAERSHPLLGPPTANVGVIEGGVRPNIVPARCEVQLSRRLLPGETAAGAREELVRSLARAGGGGQWSVGDAWWTVEPYELPAGHPLAGAIAGAAGCCGVDTEPRGFPASSDAAYFGSPVVLFGPGSLAQAHSLDEWVSVADLVTATEVYVRTVLAFG